MTKPTECRKNEEEPIVNKKLLGGLTTVLLLTGGYYASAQGLPHITLGAPTVGPTTSYAPGTPAWLEYSGSPYRIGGPKGPQPGETWEQFQYHAQPVASSSPSTVNGTPSTVASGTSTSPTYSAATTPAAPGANSPNPSASDSPYAKWATLPNLPSGWTWHEMQISGGKPITALWVPTPDSWTAQGKNQWGSSEVVNGTTYKYGVTVKTYSEPMSTVRYQWAQTYPSFWSGDAFGNIPDAISEDGNPTFNGMSNTDQVTILLKDGPTISVTIMVPDAQTSAIFTDTRDIRANFS